MPKIALVTDSTSFIPAELVQRYQITVAPQVLIWGQETFEDGVDIQPSEFYTRLAKASVMPSTSQVTVPKFQQIFQQFLDQDYQVLAVLISEKLSGTINSAMQAKAALPAGAPIEVVDSRSTAMALGFQVLAVARAIEEGASLPEAVKLAEQAYHHTGIVFAVDTLEFLHRGGRIGGGSRFLGTALNIKPILELREGKVEALERVRTRKKSLNRLIELVEAQVGGRKPVRLATPHANSPDDARALLDEAAARLGAVEKIVAELSPVVGTHAGPGTVALAYMAGL
jgi:DegV family protein with EDD domain